MSTMTIYTYFTSTINRFFADKLENTIDAPDVNWHSTFYTVSQK